MGTGPWRSRSRGRRNDSGSRRRQCRIGAAAAVRNADVVTSAAITRRKRIPDPKVAVVGCGQWGKNLVRNFHQLDALACVHDLNDEAAAAMCAAYSVPSQKFEALLADDGVEGIVIAAPAEHHAALAKAALRAGKDVFVEKPLALKVSEAEALCRLAADERRVLMVGHLIRYHPAFEKLRELCRSGSLGNVQYIYSHRLNLGKIRTEENILWSFAPHDISMILGLLDEIPKTVSAIGHAYLNHDVPDVTTTHLTFSDGRAAHVFVSWLHPFKEHRLVVVGDEGMAVFNDTLDAEEKISLFPHRVHWNDGIPVLTKAERRLIPVDEAEPLNLECRHFLHCMETGETPRTDGEEAVRVLRVLDAAQRSIEASRIIGV